MVLEHYLLPHAPSPCPVTRATSEAGVRCPNPLPLLCPSCPMANTLSPFIPGQRLQQMTQPKPEVHSQNNGLQPKTSLNGRVLDAAV